MKPRFAIGLLILFLGNPILRAQYFPDAVNLKSGEHVEGRITAETEQSVTISVDSPAGKTDRAISKSDVSSIIRAPGETPAPKPEPREPDPEALSPDKKWEYRPPDEDTPKIVKAGTNDVAGDLDACGVGTCGEPKVFWAPDSKRLAMSWGQGRTHHTDIYQLDGEKWKALKEPGDQDEILKIADDVVAAQLKQKGLSKNTRLRFIEWTVKPTEWIDPDNLVVFASMGELLQSKDLGFGGSFLITLRFDRAGNWKIVKKHLMSDKEADQFYMGED